MCGIAGLFTVEREVDRKLIEATLQMLDRQVHRGPDDWGILIPDEALRDPEVRSLLDSRGLEHVMTYPGSTRAPAAILGSRRLSIIDLSDRGRMPMGTPDGRVWVTFNGEIYNFAELRTELQAKGYAFRSSTDTETILHGYCEWGEGFVQRLRGMFAIALLDARVPGDPRLFLAKDRFGIKPLYWARKDCVLQFASEVRALMAAGLMPAEPEIRGFHGFLVYGSVPTPYTTVRDVFSLPAAHALTIDQRKYSYPKPNRYWSLPSEERANISYNEAVEETRSLLQEGVRQHLVSDVPLGVFLSGGVDSASVAALASQEASRRLNTICVSFDEASYNEGEYARSFAEERGYEHHDIRVTEAKFVEEIPKVLAAMDQPSIDGVNTYFVAKAAREAGVTVVLSGLGGDEVFGGYPGFLAGPRLHAWISQPGMRTLTNCVWAIAKMFGLERLEKVEFLRDASALGSYLAIRGLFPPFRASKILGCGRLPFVDDAARERTLTYDTYAKLEISLYLQNQLLRDTDVFGMAHNLEIRVPFLDHRLVEFVFALPQSIRNKGGVQKLLLRDAVRDLIDAKVLNRAKKGFTFPFDIWMKALPELAVSGSVPNPEASDSLKVWRSFRRGRIHWSRAWGVFVLDAFADHTQFKGKLAGQGPRRVLLLLSEVYTSQGGIPVYCRDFLRAACEAFPTAEIRVVSINDDRMPSTSILESRVHFSGCGPRDLRFLKLKVVYKAFREVLFYRPDIIICGHVNLAPLALLFKMLTNKPTMLLLYGIEAWNLSLPMRSIVERFSRVFSISRCTANRVLEAGGIKKQIELLPNAVDPDVFRPMARRSRASEYGLLTVARLDASERYKGVDTTLRALRLVRQKHDFVRYRIVGKGDDLPRLERIAEEEGVAEHVEFLGMVSSEELPSLYSGSDLFVMPSRKEGFGFVFIEALSAGLPVVAGNQDGSREAVLDGQTGLLVDPESVESVAEGICHFIEKTVDPRLQDSQRLRELTVRQFGFDRFRERVKAALSGCPS